MSTYIEAKKIFTLTQVYSITWKCNLVLKPKYMIPINYVQIIQ